MGTDTALVGLEELPQEGVINGLMLLRIRVDHGNIRPGIAASVQDSLEAPDEQLVSIVFTATALLQIHPPEIALREC